MIIISLKDVKHVPQTLLGDRYGYRPLPASLPREEFVLLRRLAREQCLPGTVTMDTWYLRDDNADPPVYLLQVSHCHHGYWMMANWTMACLRIILLV